jgi:PAS domain S-box-containing protein
VLSRRTVGTAQVVAAGELETLMAQYDTLVAHAPLGIGLFDRELRHLRVNRQLAEMNGVPEEQLVGRTPSQVNGEVGAQAERLYRQVMRSGEAMRDVAMSGEVTARPGDVRHWNVSFHPVERDGQTLGLCVIVDDVTDARRLQAELERSEAAHRQLSADLTRSLLPPVLPRLAGAEIASVYRPASGGAMVGGDFYDLVRLSETSWAMVVGDVQGKGPVAASLTSAIRYSVRTATVADPSPASVLGMANRVLLQEQVEDSLCTVAYVVAERVGDRVLLRSASAGHPLPLLVRAAGELEVLGEPGTLLGVLPDAAFVEATAELADGDALVLYTDGLTEARYSPVPGQVELFGEARLHATLRSARGLNAAGIAARAETAVLDFQAGCTADDLAIVVLQATSADG